MPESLKAQVLVKAQFEDPEIQMKNQEITKTKTVQELSQINSLAEFPIPKTIETLLEKKITLEKSRLKNYVKLHYISLFHEFLFFSEKKTPEIRFHEKFLPPFLWQIYFLN